MPDGELSHRKIGARPHGNEGPPRHDGAMSETLALKLRTWWHRDELDEQLVHGADPESRKHVCRRRAAQLRSRSMRIDLAAALENAVREAHKAWSVSARLPLARAAVRGSTDDVLALARRLRADEPIAVQGAAMAARLVFSGTSPLYGDAPISLRYSVRSARLGARSTRRRPSRAVRGRLAAPRATRGRRASCRPRTAPAVTS